MPVPITVTLNLCQRRDPIRGGPGHLGCGRAEIPVKGTLRKVDANEDNGSLVEIEKLGS